MNQPASTARIAPALLACIAAWPAMAGAAGPAFDCRKAAGEVQQLICRDDALAALDRRLDRTYKAAAAQAKGALAKRLRDDQRGWVKGRDECWKATQQTWITASWTVSTVRDCVDAQYRLRTSELQALWRLVPPTTSRQACNGSPANEVVLNDFATDPPTIRLERGDRSVTLWQVGAADAGTHEGRNVALLKREDGGVKISWLDTDSGRTEELDCRLP